MTRRRLKLKSETASELRLVAVPADVGRTVRVRSRNGSARCWAVTIFEISALGTQLNVGVAQNPLYDPLTPAQRSGRRNRGFGRRRWVLTAEVVTWKRKAAP